MWRSPRSFLRVMALAASACSGDATDTGSSGTTGVSTTDASTTGAPTTGAGTSDTSDTSDTSGGEPEWPPPFVPTPTVTVSIDPGVVLGDGPCIYRCDPAVREELPPVMDLCELVGADGRGAGLCAGGGCPAPQVCVNDEFEFASTYCELDGLGSAYCGAFPQQETDRVVVVARLLHRIVGAQLILDFEPGDDKGVPAVQVYLQEGWDEVDEMGDPYPIPMRLTPTTGAITLQSPDFAAGQTLAGAYELEFAWPDDPSIARTIRGHFAHPL